jgi:hypothetical protein
MTRRATAPIRAKESKALRAQPRNAQSRYGAKPFNPIDENADELLRVIEQELGDADFFTREDLLQCNVFQWCATITRYRYIGEAATRLLDTGRLVATSRTELALPRQAKLYRSGGELAEEFGDTIRGLALGLVRKRGAIDVPAVLSAWKTDEHLSTHVKRVTTRNAIAALVREGSLLRVARGTFAGSKAHVTQ